MPLSNAVSNTPPVHTFEFDPVSGPADLYTLFGMAAVEELLASKDKLDDKTHNLILESVSLALSVALEAAKVETSWLPLYRQATAQHKQ